MSAEDAMGDVTDWAKDHKPVAIGVVGGTVLLLALLALRRRNTPNGITGATAAGVGSASLVPYGDATSMGFTGLTGIQDATTGGFAGLTDQLAAISGLLTTMQPTGTATSGGTDTGNTVPTIGGDGSGANTGYTAQPAAAPAVSAPVLMPTSSAPATVAPQTSSFTLPSYLANLPATSQSVILSTPESQWTQQQRATADMLGLPGYVNPTPQPAPSTRALSTFDAKSQAILQSGGTVTGGDGRTMQIIGGVPTTISYKRPGT